MNTEKEILKSGLRVVIMCLLCSLILPFLGKAQTPAQKTVGVITTVEDNPPSISFQWSPIGGSSAVYIYRKNPGSMVWGSALATLSGADSTFSDTGVQVGEKYEYRIYSTGTVAANLYVEAGMEIPPVHDRGKLILLVDSLFTHPLEFEIERLILDLQGDGWQVIRHDISRYSAPLSVKSLIESEYNADPNRLKALFILGHIPVPYSGLLNPDGHPDHKGAWPADGYYGDFSTTWTDYLVNDSTASRVQNRNVPGDGKFDQNVLSSLIQLQVGRVDMHDMPAFSQNEEFLLARYLDKNHGYRHKTLSPRRKALVDDHFGYFSGESFATGGWRNFYAMFPPQDVVSGDYFTDMVAESFTWAYGCGAGSYTSCNGIGNTSSFAANAPKAVFNMLFGSYFGDWDSQNNFLRAPLASEGWGLTCSWSGRPHHLYHSMSLGESIGDGIRKSMANISTYESGYGARYVSTGLMGDPTLRLHVVAPPSALVTSFAASQVTLSWQPSPDSVSGYFVYRFNKHTGVYQPIHLQAVTTTTFLDASPDTATNFYMVRAVKLENSNSGSYFNLSQGIFDSVQTTIGVPLMSENYLMDLRIWPNPASGFANISFHLSASSEVTFWITDLVGRIVKTPVTKTLPSGYHTFTTSWTDWSEGVYMVMISPEGMPPVRRKLSVVY